MDGVPVVALHGADLGDAAGGCSGVRGSGAAFANRARGVGAGKQGVEDESAVWGVVWGGGGPGVHAGFHVCVDPVGGAWVRGDAWGAGRDIDDARVACGCVGGAVARVGV